MKNALLNRLDDQIEVMSLAEIQNNLADEIYELVNGVVQAGPFKGMQMYPDTAWPETNRSAMLLGFFEQELQAEIEREIARLGTMPNPRVVNVGCAEGYYAVGLARRLPHARVHAFDVDARAMTITRKNAEVNRVTLAEATLDEALNDADLVVMDCEGGEFSYLDPVRYPGVGKATIIVELHPDRKLGRIDERLNAWYRDTHAARLVAEGGRDPNSSSLLWRYSSFERWLAVCENRPCLMNWVVLRPQPHPARTCDGCTLCCKTERVEYLQKPKGVLCKHCDGSGCSIHAQRPAACRNFHCLWLLDPAMPDDMKPSLIGAYAYGAVENGHLNVVSTDGQEERLVEYVTQERGLHAMVERGHMIEFVPAQGRPMPPAINMNWRLT